MEQLALTIGGTPILPPAGIPAGAVSPVGENILRALINLLLLVAFVLGIIFLIWGGIRWITSAGDPKGIEGARRQILYTLIGLIIAVLAYAIVIFVGNFFGIQLLVDIPGGSGGSSSCASTEFTEFIGCDISQCSREIWRCPRTGATRTFTTPPGGGCATPAGNPACSGAPPTPTPGGGGSCTDAEFDIFLGCDTSRCSQEFWECSRTGETRSFTTPPGGGCATPEGNPACSGPTPTPPPFPCADAEYDIFLGCDTSQCSQEFWECSRTGEVQTFTTPPGGACADPAVNPAC